MIFFILVSTLTLGVFLSSASGPFVLSYGVLYGLGFLFLHSFKYGESFYRSYQSDPVLEQGNKVVLGGNLLEPLNQQDKKENRFLEVFEMRRVAIRLLIASLLVVLLNLFLQIDQSYGDFFLHTPSVLVLFIILNSFYIGHLYLALLVNLLLVVTSFQPETGVVPYSLYVLLLFCSIYVLGKRCLPSKRIFYSLCLLTFLTLGLSWFFYRQFQHPFFHSPLILDIDLEKSKPLRDFLQNQRLEMNNDLASEANPQASELLSTIQGLERIAKKEKISESERQFIQQQASEVFDKLAGHRHPKASGELNDFKLSGQEMDVINSLSLNQASNMTSSQSDLGSESPYGGGNHQMIPKDQMAPLNDLETNTLRSILEKAQQDPSQHAVTEKLNQILSHKEVTLQERRELVETMKSTLSKTSPKSPAASSQIPDIDQQQKMLSAFDPPKERDWWQLFKRFMPILFLVTLSFILHYLLKRKKITKVLTNNPEDLSELQLQWRELRKKKLSAREEVIQGYNFFHQALQKIHYPDHEAPPSCLIHQDMQAFNPDLEKATFVITEVFARCFYGDKDVPLEHLVKFRKALSKTFIVYQIQK